MVTVVFKMSKAGTLKIECTGSMNLESLLQKCLEQADVELGGTMVVRQGNILQMDDTVVDGDTIEVFPAISGG